MVGGGVGEGEGGGGGETVKSSRAMQAQFFGKSNNFSPELYLLGGGVQLALIHCKAQKTLGNAGRHFWVSLNP